VSKVLPPILALSLVIASGLFQGRWSGRWSHSDEIEKRLAALARVPRSFGDWESQDTVIDARTRRVAGLDGYLARRYHNRRDGSEVSVLLVSGRPGPISVHTPEICFPGNGFEQASETALRSVKAAGDATPDAFFAVNFQKSDGVLPEKLRVLYSWSPGGDRWTAPANPRLRFAGVAALYKLYVTWLVSGDVMPGRDDPATAFTGEFLPVLRKALSTND
jgi:hypothetical protein